MASPCLCKPPMASGPASRVKPVTKLPFGRASPRAAALGEALSNDSFVTGFTCEDGSEAIGGLHRQGETMKSWLHAVYTSI